MNYSTFLSLIRLGIGHGASVVLNPVDWPAVQGLAEEQGLLGIVADAVALLPPALRPPEEVLLKIMGEVLIDYELRYEHYQEIIGEMLTFYNVHGFKTMVLKGFACSLDWPIAEHRPCGDIDIWQFGRQKEADAELSKKKGIKVDRSHHHHTVFDWGDFVVENHYDFISVYAHRSSVQIEKVLKELGRDDSHFTLLRGEKLYLPSANLHALFLMRHMSAHFAATELSLRQVLDWAFFVEKHSVEVDWPWLTALLEEYRMTSIFRIFNAICVENLGFPRALFPSIQSDAALKEKVLFEMLHPQFGSAVPEQLLPRLAFKIRRWRGSRWKNELVYDESRWSSFWRGVWGHLLKPSSL